MKIPKIKPSLYGVRFILVISLFILCISLIAITVSISWYYTNKGTRQFLDSMLRVSYYSIEDTIRTDFINKKPDDIIGEDAIKVGYLNGLFVRLVNRNGEVLADSIKIRNDDLPAGRYKSEYIFIDSEYFGELTVYTENGFGLMHPSARIFFTSLRDAVKYSIIVGILFSIVVISAIAERITRPLIELKKQANSVKYLKKNNLSAHTKIKEVNALANALNYMIGMFNGQEEWRQGLLDDLNHELRTPLTIISTQLEAILDGVVEYSTERLENITNEVNRLTRLLTAIQELSIAEGAKFELKYNKTDLCSMVGKVVSGFMPECKKRRLELAFSRPYEPCSLICDQDKVTQAVFNIISNAVKYSYNNSKIEVSIKVDKEINITVKDYGIGIPEDCMESIFKRFYRVDASRSIKAPGSGLGLCIAKSLIEAHGGEITVNSKYHSGSTFTITLPKDSAI